MKNPGTSSWVWIIAFQIESFGIMLRIFSWAFEFQSWDDFLLFVITHARGG
jgi:hypothetical protein